MEEFRDRLIYLCHFPGITWNEIFNILKRDPQLSNLSNHNPQRYFQFKEQKKDLTHSYLYEYYPNFLHDQIRQYPLKGIEVITYFDNHYPHMLKEIFQPPWCIFLIGKSSLINKGKKLAIVGSRETTPYGKNAISHILPPLIKSNFIIVSGLAKGIDALAHQTALDLAGNTIAVIAGGFYHLYPKENEQLANRLITSKNLIISEYPPTTKPMKWHFPARNRIISGLCDGTVIIEAKRRSGSLITANYAVQEGREVFAVPGSIFSPNSEGTNDLIQQGAKLVMSGEDILAELRL